MARKKKDEDERIDPFANGSNDAAEVLSEAIAMMEEYQAEINERQESIREIMRDLGGKGFNTKVVRRAMKVKKDRAANPERFDTEEHEFHTYLSALGIDIGSEY